MAHMLDMTASLELAKQFLKAPHAMFVLHETYKKRGEELGVKSVPNYLVSPETVASGCFLSFEEAKASALEGPVDDSFVKDWWIVLREAEEHAEHHIESLKMLQHHYRVSDETPKQGVNYQQRPD